MRQKLGCTSDGQLIRLAIPAARELGINLQVLGAHSSNSVFRILSAKRHGVIVPNKDWSDHESLIRFAQAVGEGNPVTTEWGNVPLGTLQTLEQHGLISRPNTTVIELIQDRLREKILASSAGGTPVPSAGVNSFDDLETYFQVDAERAPCILKTRGGGYDGKGQGKSRKEWI